MASFDFARALRSPEGKAIPDHPVFHDGVPTSVYAPGASRQDAKLSDRSAGRHLEGYGGKQAIDYLMDAVNLYGDTVSTADWRLMRDDVPMVRKRTSDTPPDYEEGPADLYRLLDQPNPHQLYHELIELLVIDLLIAGNAYWLKWRSIDGKPLALYRLAPQYVKIIPGAFGPKRYEYQPKGAKEPLKFNPEEVLHFRRPNPHDAYYGMGIVKGGGRTFDLELSLTETMVAHFDNKAEPSLIIQSERRVPRDVFNKLRAQLRSRVSGPSNNGELLVLEAGLTATTLSPSAQQAMFEELSHMTRDRIFAMFRAHPKLFGYGDQTGGNDKVSDARREFDTYVIRPFMDKLQSLISFGLTQAWGVNFDIEYRYTAPPEELLKNASLLAAIPGIKVRELRAYLGPIGLKESTGDREIDEEILNMPLPEMDENGQGGGADRNLVGEAGRPPKGANTTSLGQASNRAGAKALTLEDVMADLDLRLERAQGKAVIDRPAENVGSPVIAGEVRPSDPFEVDRSRDVDEISNSIQDGLAEAVRLLERELLDHVEGKAFKTNNLRSRLRNSPAWKAYSDRVEDVLMDAARKAISRSVMQSGRIPEEDLDYDAIAESVVKRPNGLRSIVRTTKERLLKRVGAQLEKKDVTQEMVMAEVQEFVREFRADDGHSRTIALSEAVESYNEGTLSVAEVVGVPEVYVVDGEDHDDECAEANGQTWPVEQARAARKAHTRCRRYFLLPEPTSAA